MAIIQFEDGTKVKFNGTPTPEDVEEVANQLGINKPKAAPSTEKPAPEKKSVLRKIGDFLTSAEQSFGETLGAAASAISPEVNKNRNAILKQAQKQSDNYLKLASQEKDRAKKQKLLEAAKKSADTAGLDIFSNPEYQKTAKQIAGEGLGVLVDLASAGTYGQAAKAAKTGKYLSKANATKNIVKPVYKTAGEAFIKGAAKEAPRGAAIGASYGAANAMQENKGGAEIVKESATGAITGGLLSGILSGLDAKKKFLAPGKAEDLKKKAVAQYQRGLNSGKEKFKEKGDKIIPELLDKKVWGSFRGLMKKADEGIEMAEKDYEKLGELHGIIGTSGILEKIDKKMAGMLRPDGTVISIKQTSFKELQKLKDDILAYNTKSWIAGAGVETMTAEQQKLRELAANYGKELYDTRKAMKTINDSKTLSQVKTVDAAIRDLLNSKNPEYEKINKVYHLNTSLKDILIDTAQRKNSHRMVNIVRAITGSGGAGLGAAMGGLPGAVVGGLALTATAEVLNSTWYNTLKAVQKNALADKLLKQSKEEMSYSLLLLARYGSKYVDKLLNE